LTKLWPLILLPGFVASGRRRATEWILWSLGVGVAVWMAIGGSSAVAQVVTFRGASGWGAESIIGSIVWVASGDQVRIEAGAPRVGVMPPHVGIALAVVLLAIEGAIWWAAFRRDGDAFGSASTASVCALLACSPLFSMQYVAWLLPWAAIAGVKKDRATVGLVFVAASLTSALYVILGPERVAIAQTLVLIRNAVIVAIPVVWLMRSRHPV
jgi:hypothetical protein